MGRRRQGVRPPARRPLTAVLVLPVLAWCIGAVGAGPAAASASSPAAPASPSSPAGRAGLVGDPASLVNPFAGTGTGSVSPGSVGEFPGADVPFGMIQWSPDTTPDRTTGSGYSYQDSEISGFSLTHLSGSGCAAYGDVPILPTVGTIGAAPASSADPLSHATERASPGRYQVTLGSTGITTRLAVTTRTGISGITFPRRNAAHVLFKVSTSASGVLHSAVSVVGHDEVSGEVTSGQFCGTGTDYTLYFFARFDRPFVSSGSWEGSAVDPGGTTCTGARCGAYVTFDTASDDAVTMKVGISFVSVANAAANLHAEDPGWSLAQVESRATARWNAVLGRIRIGGGTRAEQRTFYTALYHSLLYPNVVSDVDGQYAGADGRVQRRTTGAQYANFSEWDIYRSEIELVSLLAPEQAGTMLQSLVDDAQQTGWLPKWAIVAGDASQMNGDSADPIIAAAYAFGVRGFDVKAALRAMVKGATETESPHGLEIERQYLSQYLSQHYVDATALDLDSSNYSIGGSVTLEYAVDDFSIAQMALSEGNRKLYATMMRRAHNWEYLFNPATGYIQARETDGSFPPGPAFNPTLLEPGGEEGFEEGNAVQYTWSVPQDLAALGSLMGGDADAVAKLNSYFTELNAGRSAPYDWAGNEPSLWTPWEYDYFDAPWRTQAVVRQIADTLYSDAPVDEPGNDDLGAISSWYVWAAVGLYPVTPGTADLALASPLFPDVVLTLPDGHLLTVHAPQASAGTPYVHSLTVSGASLPASGTTPPASTPSCSGSAHSGSAHSGSAHSGSAHSGSAGGTWDRPWVPASILRTGGTLTYDLSATPDRSWGAAPADSPPSYGTGRIPAVGYSLPSGGVSLEVDVPTTITVGVKSLAPGTPSVTWRATTTGALSLSTAAGTFKPAARAGATPSECPSPAPVTAPLTVTAHAPGSATVEITMRTTSGQALPPVVVDVSASS